MARSRHRGSPAAISRHIQKLEIRAIARLSLPPVPPLSPLYRRRARSSVLLIGLRGHRRERRLALLEQAQNASSRREHIDLGRLPMTTWQTRRRFLTMTALAGAAGFLQGPRTRAAERELETTSVRLAKQKESVICFAPQYVCEALLRAEGFTDVRYVDTTAVMVPEDLGRAGSTSLRVCHSFGSTRSMPACRLSSSPACMPAVTSCSPMGASAASPT